MSELHEVVLSGIGAITARGDFTLHSTSTALADLDEDTLPRESSIIQDFKLEDYLTSQKTYLDRCSALALAGCALALRDAGFTWPVGSTQDEIAAASGGFGITLGTHLGCIETMNVFWEKATERGVRLANPLLFSHSYFNSPISLCAIEFGLKGYHTTFCAGHDSGLEAVRAAHDAIRLGHAGAMLCGGVEAVSVARESFEPVEAMGEAAVFFVLERVDHPTRRNVRNLPYFPLEEAIFSLTGRERDAVRARLGDCGGAEGALCLAYLLTEGWS
jgi:3-oxoacyl-(acyl-carrier-protein) synthase